mmetsp:Transcript_2940/g.9946  ORF Transcript_2940/g.9946 Transcript_2940/m.9946 type:complete len:207 (-) Transcript_2940:292-912(-)
MKRPRPLSRKLFVPLPTRSSMRQTWRRPPFLEGIPPRKRHISSTRLTATPVATGTAVHPAAARRPLGPNLRYGRCPRPLWRRVTWRTTTTHPSTAKPILKSGFCRVSSCTSGASPSRTDATPPPRRGLSCLARHRCCSLRSIYPLGSQSSRPSPRVSLPGPSSRTRFSSSSATPGSSRRSATIWSGGPLSPHLTECFPLTRSSWCK